MTLSGSGPDDAALDVYGLGQCALDHLLLVPRHPGPHEKVEGTQLTRQCGGPVATALWTLARWGRRCAFAGVVGDDEAGRRIRHDLDRSGVDTSRLLVRAGHGSQEAFIAAVARGGDRRIVWQRPTGPPPARGEVDVPAARLLLTDGLFAEASLEAARRAPLVLVDAGTLREGTRQLLDHAQVFVASEAFARAFVGRDDPELACRRIRDAGPQVAAVTLGEEGYVASFGDTWLVRPAWPAQVVDTTGCGDVFHAGIAEGLLAGWPLERTFDFAAWAAAGCASRLGGRAGVEPKEAYPAR